MRFFISLIGAICLALLMSSSAMAVATEVSIQFLNNSDEPVAFEVHGEQGPNYNVHRVEPHHASYYYDEATVWVMIPTKYVYHIMVYRTNEQEPICGYVVDLVNMYSTIVFSPEINEFDVYDSYFSPRCFMRSSRDGHSAVFVQISYQSED